MRHLRVWTADRQPVGMALVRLTVTLCILMAGVRLFAEPLRLDLPVWPAGSTPEWYGRATTRAPPARRLLPTSRSNPESHSSIVRYSPNHQPLNEWVYNAADIDNSKVVWAREMDETNNRELIHYYKDRTVWLVEPDEHPARASPYLPATQAP